MEYMYVLEDPGNATNTTDIDPAEASRLLTAKIVILFCMLVNIQFVQLTKNRLPVAYHAFCHSLLADGNTYTEE
jgi:hypothetical protein